jgi:UDP-glucuronate decarboxylase
VVALDNLSTGHPALLATLHGHPRFHFEQHDITEPLPHAMREVGSIYNLACPASPTYRRRHPVATVLASSLGTWRLLELTRACGARLLQTSTSEVYGDVEPRSCHDEGKRNAEALCYAYAREHGVAVRVARLFNCYGPRLRPNDGRVVSNFIVQALTGQPLTIYGDGQQTRCFCFVSDAVNALHALMASGWSTPIDIGNPREHSVLELAQQVLALTGRRSALTFRPLPPGDPARRQPDVRAAREVLQWQPSVELEEGLLRTIAHFRRVLKEASRSPVPAEVQ